MIPLKMEKNWHVSLRTTTKGGFEETFCVLDAYPYWSFQTQTNPKVLAELHDQVRWR